MQIANKAAKVARHREDVSRFVVHLTRDDRKTFTNGSPARKNFLSILKEKEIRAYSAHCLHSPRLKSVPKELRNGFHVSCFTETPLNHLRQLVQEIPGRQVRLEPYGFVFLREFLVESGGQPAIYINSYGENGWLREGVEELFRCAAAGKEVNKKLCRLLPFINAMHEKYDFSWEREWRVRGTLEFDFSDLVCVILPEEGETEIKDLLAEGGIAAISPDWTYEQIVAELSRQQRATKSLLEKRLNQLTQGLKASEKAEANDP